MIIKNTIVTSFENVEETITDYKIERDFQVHFNEITFGQVFISSTSKQESYRNVTIYYFTDFPVRDANYIRQNMPLVVYTDRRKLQTGSSYLYGNVHIGVSGTFNPSPPPPSQPSPSLPQNISDEKNNTLIIVLSVIGGVLLISLTIAFIYYKNKKSKIVLVIDKDFYTNK